MQRVKNTLIASGLTVWSDEEIQIGTASWVRAIDLAIRQAGCIVVILSPEAATSFWVGEELQFARIQNKRAFPIWAKGEEQDAIPLGIAGAQAIDIRTESDYEVKVSQLVNSVHQYLKREAVLTEKPNRQLEQQETNITQQIYQQLRDYRAQIVGYQIKAAAQNRDALAAHIAKLEAERDYRVIEIDFELNHSNHSATREYFLHWLRIHQFYWHNYRLAVGNREPDDAVKARSESARQLNQYHQEFMSAGKALNLFELSNYFYLELVKYIRGSETVSLSSLKWHFLINDSEIVQWLERLEQDHIIENMHDKEGSYKPL
jgi:hypothetical protein